MPTTNDGERVCPHAITADFADTCDLPLQHVEILEDEARLRALEADLDMRSADLEERESDVKKRSAALEARKADLDKREEVLEEKEAVRCGAPLLARYEAR